MQKKKTVKGFTLVELLIVCAVFTMLMVGALSLLKPVSEFYKQNVEYQEAISSIDMIGDFLEGKLRTCSKIRICDQYSDYSDSWAEDVAKNNFDIIDPTNNTFTENMFEISVDNNNGGRIAYRMWEAGTVLAASGAPTSITTNAISGGVYLNHEFDIAIEDYSTNITPTGFEMDSFNIAITAHRITQVGGAPVVDPTGVNKALNVRLLNIAQSDASTFSRDTFDTQLHTTEVDDNPLLGNATQRAFLDYNTTTTSDNFHIFFTVPHL